MKEILKLIPIKSYRKFFQVQTQNRPQAIFTSFKLEKNGKAASSLPAPTIDSSFQVKTPTQQTSPENHTDDGGSGSSKEASSSFAPHNRLSDSGGGSHSNSERKRRLSFSSSTSTEPEKVSIVRAAGTFFPQNCNDNENDATTSLLAQPTTRRKSKENTDYLKKCGVAGCNEVSDSSHVHCDHCSEVDIPWILFIVFVTKLNV